MIKVQPDVNTKGVIASRYNQKFSFQFSNMNLSQKSEKKLVKRTVIPVHILDDPKQLRGLMRFSTELAKTPIHPFKCQTQHKSKEVIYKNQLVGKTVEEKEEDQDLKKKEIEFYEVTISPARLKNKVFKVEIPIVKGSKSVKNSKANDLYFTFCFSNSEGKLALMNGLYEAKSQFTNKSKKELDFKEKANIQLSKLDNRRKNDYKEGKHKPQSSESNQQN